MPSGIYKRSTPIQDKLDDIKRTILKDTIDRERNFTELAKSYGVSRGSLVIYYKEYNLRKCRRITKGYKCKSKMKDLKDYIKENNITRSEIINAIIEVVKDQTC